MANVELPLDPFSISLEALELLPAEERAKYHQAAFNLHREDITREWRSGEAEVIVCDGRIIKGDPPGGMVYYVFKSPSTIEDLEAASSTTKSGWPYGDDANLLGSDILTQIFFLQKKFDGRVESSFAKISGNYLSETEKRIDKKMTAIIHEAVELQRLCNWKWWKTPKAFDKEAAREELMDIWHFVVSATLDLEMTPEQVLEEYKKKNAINHQRQDQGY